MPIAPEQRPAHFVTVSRVESQVWSTPEGHHDHMEGEIPGIPPSLLSGTVELWLAQGLVELEQCARRDCGNGDIERKTPDTHTHGHTDTHT